MDCIHLPKEILQNHLLTFLSIEDLVKLDTAVTSKNHRPLWLSKLEGFVYDFIYPLGHDEAIDWLVQRKLNVKQLTLDDISSSNPSFVFNASNHFKTLLSIAFVGEGVSDIHAMSFAYGCPELRRMSICHGEITDNTLMVLGRMCHQLQSFDCCCEKLSDSGIAGLARGCPDLRLLDLDIFDAHSIITDASLQALGENCKQLTTLKISGPRVNVTDAGLSTFGGQCSRLQTISCKFGANVTDDGMEEFVRFCGPELRHINIYGNRLTARSFIDIAQKCTNIKSLDFNRALITDEVLTALGANCRYIEKLLFGDNLLITDAGFQALKRCNTLNYVSVGSCPLLTDNAIIAISELPNLQTINLFDFPSMTENALFAIADNCSHLESIMTWGPMHISDAGVIRIGQSCPALKEVYFRNNQLQISDAAVISLARPTLQGLTILGSENVTDASVVAISHLCKQLQGLIITGCSTTRISLFALAAGCPALMNLTISLSNDDLDALEFFKMRRPNVEVYRS